MSRRFAALLLLAAGCRGEREGVPPARPPAPGLRVEPATHDIGVVAEGERIDRSFRVHNDGSAKLRIEPVLPSFGCSAEPGASFDVEPGSSLELRVRCETQGKAGKYRVTLVVRSNDPKQPRRELELAGKVEPLLAFEPFFAELKTSFGKPVRHEARVVGTERANARLRVLDVGDRALSAKVLPASHGRSPGLELELRAERVGSGSGRVLIATGLRAPEQIALSYSWTVRGNLRVDPERPYLNLRASGPKITRVLVESSRPDFELRAVDVLSGPFRTRFERAPKPGSYLLEVSADESTLAAGARGTLGKLLLTSNDPAEPQKELEVFAFGKLL